MKGSASHIVVGLFVCLFEAGCLFRLSCPRIHS
ncbi:rCG61940 [Rattus norvegicus]|uniref:RCG61940 n=1 Tax=Rattus norvegicus TaxID=10116 RepID=A6H9L8_RAT|nr:rCG61940 [Rattus norvegicus]